MKIKPLKISRGDAILPVEKPIDKFEKKGLRETDASPKEVPNMWVIKFGDWVKYYSVKVWNGIKNFTSGTVEFAKNLSNIAASWKIIIYIIIGVGLLFLIIKLF